MKYEILKQYGNADCKLASEQLIRAHHHEGAVSVFAAASNEIRIERPCGKVTLFDTQAEERWNPDKQAWEWVKRPILGYEKGRVIDGRGKGANG